MGRIGQLHERVVIQQATETTTTAPSSTVTWSTVDTVWARVEPLMASERIQAQAMQSTASYRVTIRYRTDVTTTNRLTWDGKTLQIHGVTKVGGRDVYLEMLCGETA